MAVRPLARPTALSGTLGEAIAEFFGTMVLILFGDGCVASFALFNKLPGAVSPFANEWIVIILGWGLAVMLGVYAAGAISGAHINPAVTLALAARGKFPWNKVLPYWAAQVLGAFIAAVIVYLVYHGAIDHYIISNTVSGVPLRNTLDSIGRVFYTGPQPFVGL